MVMSCPGAAGFAQPHELEELWRIGGSEKDEVLFGYVRDVAVDSKGIVYAADFQHSSVYAFSSAGALVSEIGRKGEGPGEFDQLSSLS